MSNSSKNDRRIHPIVKPKPGIAGRTSEWRTSRPDLDKEECTKCNACIIHCPDDVIEIGNDGYPEIDQYYCKGCMICMAVCRPEAIFEIATLPGGEKDA